MAKKKRQRIIECPKCFNHFHIIEDVINRLCTRCNQWCSALDFNSTRSVCKTCLGIIPTRFSTQIRLRTKKGDLLKQCGKCGLWKPEGSYSKDNAAQDGLQNWCMDCNNKFRAEKRVAEKEPV